MTDNENIKAFECCYVEDSCLDCNECPIKNKMVDEAPCDKCIDKTDLALCKPANETEFSNYERDDTK